MSNINLEQPEAPPLLRGKTPPLLPGTLRVRRERLRS
jgi:hypothetical protein